MHTGMLFKNKVKRIIMKHKVGDKVKIKSLEWYLQNSEDNAVINNGTGFTDAMVRYCGRTTTITGIYHDSYYLYIDDGDWYWYDWMFEYDPLNEADSDGAELKEINHD